MHELGTSDSREGLSWVVPFYNEAGALQATLTRLRKILETSGLPWEIIAVDDGSTDESGRIAEAVERVRVIRHPMNAGYGLAIKTGIRNARYNWIGIVDADGTYPIERLPDLVARMRQGFDMAVASRTAVGDMDRPQKRLFRRMYRLIINVLVGRTVDDANSGFRIFRRRLVITFFPFLCNTFSFTTSLTLFAIGGGFFVDFLPIEYFERTGRSKVRHVRDSLRTAQLIFQGVSYFNPVKFYLMLALAVVVFVGLPSLVLDLAGWTTAAFYVLTTGMALAVLAGLGILCDTLRIAVLHRTVAGDAVPEAERSPATGRER